MVEGGWMWFRGVWMRFMGVGKQFRGVGKLSLRCFISANKALGDFFLFFLFC